MNQQSDNFDKFVRDNNLYADLSGGEPGNNMSEAEKRLQAALLEIERQKLRRQEEREAADAKIQEMEKRLIEIQRQQVSATSAGAAGGSMNSTGSRFDEFDRFAKRCVGPGDFVAQFCYRSAVSHI